MQGEERYPYGSQADETNVLIAMRKGGASCACRCRHDGLITMVWRTPRLLEVNDCLALVVIWISFMFEVPLDTYMLTSNSRR